MLDDTKNKEMRRVGSSQTTFFLHHLLDVLGGGENKAFSFLSGGIKLELEDFFLLLLLFLFLFHINALQRNSSLHPIVFFFFFLYILTLISIPTLSNPHSQRT